MENEDRERDGGATLLFPCLKGAESEDQILRLKGGAPECRSADIKKVLQINVDRGARAQDLVEAIARQRQIDIIACQEPNRASTRNGKWLLDDLENAAIRLTNNKAAIEDHGRGGGFVWLKVGGTVYVSCYISPNCSMATFEQFLDELEAMIIGIKGEYIIMGDMNAKSPEWRAPWGDDRGKLLSKWIAANNLAIQNRGDSPTFVRRDTISYIDVTVTNMKLASRVEDWTELETESLSYHKYIEIIIAPSRQVITNPKVSTDQRTTRYRVDTLDHDKFQNVLQAEIEKSRGNRTPDKFIATLKKACETAMHKKTFRAGTRAVYWWTAEIGEARDLCNRKRRIVTRLTKI